MDWTKQHVWIIVKLWPWSWPSAERQKIRTQHINGLTSISVPRKVKINKTYRTWKVAAVSDLVKQDIILYKLTIHKGVRKKYVQRYFKIPLCMLKIKPRQKSVMPIKDEGQQQMMADKVITFCLQCYAGTMKLVTFIFHPPLQALPISPAPLAM